LVCRNASLLHFAARVGMVAAPLIWCGASGLAQPSQAPAAAHQYELGQPISLDKGMTLTMAVRKPQGATVASDTKRTIEWGMAVSLTFVNSGNEPVEQAFFAGDKPGSSNVTLLAKKTKALAPIGMIFGKPELGAGESPADSPGGTPVRGCTNVKPYRVNDPGSRGRGLAGKLCTRPGATDTVLMLFENAADLRKAEVQSIRVTCGVCPKKGLVVKADLDQILSTP